MQAFKTGKVTHLLLLTLITGCAEWNSIPTVVDQNYGRAYTNMVKNQTLCPVHGQMAKDPKLCPEHGPVMAMDGQKPKVISMPIERLRKRLLKTQRLELSILVVRAPPVLLAIKYYSWLRLKD